MHCMRRLLATQVNEQHTTRKQDIGSTSSQMAKAGACRQRECRQGEGTVEQRLLCAQRARLQNLATAKRGWIEAKFGGPESGLLTHAWNQREPEQICCEKLKQQMSQHTASLHECVMESSSPTASRDPRPVASISRQQATAPSIHATLCCLVSENDLVQ